MSVLAIVRPSDWEYPLFVHVLGAMLLVGGVLLVALALVLAWRSVDRRHARTLTQLAYRALFVVVLPAYVVMRIGAQWIEREEGWGDDEPDWLGIGYVVGDLVSWPLLLASLVMAAIGLRRVRAAGDESAGGDGLGRAVAVVTVVLLFAYVVAIWAMTAKPT